MSSSGVETIRNWSGRLPTHLYRFRSMHNDEARERVRSILVDSQLYYGRFNAMNDPFEGRLRPGFSVSKEEVRRYWRERPEASTGVPPSVRDARIEALAAEASGSGPHPLHEEVIARFVGELGVCCFMGRFDDIPMWSYYGDSHRGVCLRFRFDRPFLQYMSAEEAPPFPVEYRDTFPRPRFYDNDVVALVTTLVSTKASAWAHEEEWRIVSQKGPGARTFPPELLDAVIVGERIENEALALIRGWTRDRGAPTTLLQAHSSASEFKIEARPLTV